RHRGGGCGGALHLGELRVEFRERGRHGGLDGLRGGASSFEQSAHGLGARLGKRLLGGGLRLADRAGGGEREVGGRVVGGGEVLGGGGFELGKFADRLGDLGRGGLEAFGLAGSQLG